jgi:mono/diheme cytochrome c family protein
MRVPWCSSAIFLACSLASGAADLPSINIASLEKLPPAAPGTVDYARDVQPLLAERCYKCHGPEKEKNGLRLDRKTDVLTGGDSGPALLPGKSGESRLIQYVAGVEEDKVMPPKGPRLSPAQIGLLRAWIDQGVSWPEPPVSDGSGVKPAATSRHWSFRAPVRAEAPLVAHTNWVRNPIDQFIVAKLEAEKIEPSAKADPYTLVRRVCLDLTGLPPTREQVDAFVHEPSPTAYDKLVDTLLGSPHYGEQWARHWLDLARYADTDGYEKDFYRPHAWRWRDWVIDSINRDQPFDEFTRDQIAGDLLPGATVDERVATGFHRNTLLNREGGVDIEEDRCKIVVDRVSTVGTTWLGLTVGCAECHTHKYDPIPQKEFYQLYAFFNSTDDRDIKAPVPVQQEKVQAEETALAAAKRLYASEADPGLEKWAEEVAHLPEIWFSPKVEDYDLPTFGANNGANLYPQEDGSFLVTGMIENKTHYLMMLNTKATNITGIRVEAITDEMLPKLGPGWSSNGNFVLTELSVESASLKNVSALRSNAIESVVADYSQPGYPIAAAIDGVTTNGGWAVDMPQLPMHAVDRCAVFTLKESIGEAEGMRLKVSLVQNQGNSHTLGRVRVTYTSADRAELIRQAVPQRIRDLARIPAAMRTLDEKVTLKRYYQCTFEPSAPDLLQYTKIMAESPGVKGEVQAQTLTERHTPRPTYVHVRGNFLDKGARVEPGVLSALHPFQPRHPGQLPDRLDLANWLTDRANPLTARVTVNRMWMHLFGEGLVTSVADFGNQGDKPSHPELLDWLATEFVRQHWSRKAMIKLLVTSATYQQSSEVREDLLERDAKNRWLARQNRFRLSAENTRDQYLAASGLLDGRVGGQSTTPDSKRRGIYLQFKRSFPEYMLVAFDAPATTQTCPKRERSNTPLQALTLMNDAVFVACAQDLARHMVADGPGEAVAARIRSGFARCLARPPSEDELSELLRLWRQVKQIYYESPAAAIDVAGKLALRDVPAPEAAAYAVVARTVLNLDEMVTRE